MRFILIFASLGSYASDGLEFMQFYQNLDQDVDLPQLNHELVVAIAENHYQLYDNSYMNTQEECFLADAENENIQKRCEKILSFYEDVNEQLNAYLELDTGENSAELESLASNILGQAVEIDTFLDGKTYTKHMISQSDTHWELKQQVDRHLAVAGENSLASPGEEVLIHNLLCRPYEILDLNLPQDVLTKLISELEAALVSSNSSLSDKQKIFCLLLDYYQKTQNEDKLIMFLFLNMPAGDLSC